MSTPCIYLITNKISNKIYVGKSTTEENRWSRHLRIAKGGKEKYPNSYSYIHAALNKYGSNNFTFEIIKTFQTEVEALNAEIQLIAELKLKNIQIYNLTDGGEGTSGYKHSKETIAKISGKGNAFYGKKHTTESKRKISQSLIGENNPMFGTHHSDETRTKQSQAKIEIFKGENNPNSKLNQENVNQIKNAFQQGTTRSELAKKYNVSWTCINKIINNETW